MAGIYISALILSVLLQRNLCFIILNGNLLFFLTLFNYIFDISFEIIMIYLNMNNTITPEKLKKELEAKLAFLSDWNLEYDYSIENGIIGDRIIHKFTFDNIQLKKKLVIVYCEKGVKTLEGFLINYEDTNPNYLDFKNYVSFDRLRVLVNSNDIIFYGNKQYDISYKIEEINQVIHEIKNQLTTKEWIDFNELKKIELEKDRGDYEKSRYASIEGTQQLIQKLDKQKTLNITYNPIGQPPYEEQDVQITNKYGDVFRVSYGHFSRYDSGYIVQNIEEKKIVNSKIIYDSRYMDRTLMSYCKKKFKYDKS